MNILLMQRGIKSNTSPSASTLLANFLATNHTESSGNLTRWTQNGVTGYNRRWVSREEFLGGSPSGTHAYKMNLGDSVGNVEEGVTGGIAEFGLVFPEDYGEYLAVEWKQFNPNGVNGPALNILPGQGLGQFKIFRAWPLNPGETISDDGEESYNSNAKMGFSEFSAAGLTAIYGFRDWNSGSPSNYGQGGDPWFITQHPPSGAKDQFIVNPSRNGQWNTCRVLLRVQDQEVTDVSGPGNGIAKFWINGILINSSGEDFRNFPGEGISRIFRYACIFGSRDGKTYPNECVWIDDIKVYKNGFPEETETVYAYWNNMEDTGEFSGGGSATFIEESGVGIARFEVSGANTGQNRVYYPIPSSYMTDGKELHLAFKLRMPETTLDVLATNLGSPPYPQIKFHLARAESDPPKWGGQAYRFSVAAMGVATNAEAPNTLNVKNDWFNHSYIPNKASSSYLPDTWGWAQISYRDDGENAYVRAWFNGVEVGSESISNDNTSDGGSNNNGGSEGNNLTYNMSFGIEFSQCPGAQTDTLRVDVQQIVISNYHLPSYALT